jgi:hypothetical protein
MVDFGFRSVANQLPEPPSSPATAAGWSLRLAVTPLQSSGEPSDPALAQSFTLHGFVPHHSRLAQRSIAVAVHDGPR